MKSKEDLQIELFDRYLELKGQAKFDLFANTIYCLPKKVLKELHAVYYRKDGSKKLPGQYGN